MQKAYNIISAIAFVGFGIWIFFLIRANMQWKSLLVKSVVPAKSQNVQATSASTDTQPAVADNQQNITMGEMWESLKQKIGQVKVELDLK